MSHRGHASVGYDYEYGSIGVGSFESRFCLVALLGVGLEFRSSYCMQPCLCRIFLQPMKRVQDLWKATLLM